jgi:hypothetical protein
MPSFPLVSQGELSKNSWGNIFSKQSRVNEWQPMTAGEIHVLLALFMPVGTAQKPSLRWYFSSNQIADHLKYSIGLVECLLVKYSVMHAVSGRHDGDIFVKRLTVLHAVSGHRDGDSFVKRLTECHFPRKPPTEKKRIATRRCVVCSKRNKR